MHTLLVRIRLLNDYVGRPSFVEVFEDLSLSELLRLDITPHLTSVENWADKHMAMDANHRMWTIDPRNVM